MKITINNNDGFTYLAVLTLVIIMGIMLAMVGQSWKAINQREMEEELLFRGEQVAEVVYQKLLCSNHNKDFAQPAVYNWLWNKKTANGTILDDLVKTGIPVNCYTGGQRLFKLRPSAAIDPFTKKQWEILTPATSTPPVDSPPPAANGFLSSSVVLSPKTSATSSDDQHFTGVKSTSELKPFKEKFNLQYELPLKDAAKNYSEWLFTWELAQKMESAPNQAVR